MVENGGLRLGGAGGGGSQKGRMMGSTSSDWIVEFPSLTRIVQVERLREAMKKKMMSQGKEREVNDSNGP